MSIWDFAEPQRAADAVLVGSIIRDDLSSFRGVLGCGIVGPGSAIGLLVDYRRFTIEPPQELRSYPLEAAPELFEGLAGLAGDAPFLKGITLWAITPPMPEVAPGDWVTALCTGRLGPGVKWGTSSEGVLCVGHVAAPVGIPAMDGSTIIGDVVLSLNPAGSGSTISPDVAVIDFANYPTTMGAYPTTIVAPSPADDLYVAGLAPALTPKAFGFLQWLNMPSVNGTYGDIVMTDIGVTNPGDSGSLVVGPNGDAVGLVVGGSGTITSYVQALDYQLNAVRGVSSTFANAHL